MAISIDSVLGTPESSSIGVTFISLWEYFSAARDNDLMRKCRYPREPFVSVTLTRL